MPSFKLIVVALVIIAAGFLTACDNARQTATSAPYSSSLPEPESDTEEGEQLADTGSRSDSVDADLIGNEVETRLGVVRGELITERGMSARIFRGVPYAAAPVGELRWRAPQPAEPWEGVLDAREWADRCPQGSSSMGTGNSISEDCLHLNVVTAAPAAEAGLPVMVFFHGGGLTTGTANSTTYNHPALPNNGVVLVSVNSRLGPMGYLAHPALSAESEQGVSGNYGTLDLVASLQWVQENIAAFGGDPDNVTIFGESGGGTKTISQMVSPLTEGLFHKAIVQSGSALVSRERITMLEEAEAIGEKLVAALGIDETGDVLAEMRARSWEEIIETASSDEVGFRANVVVDGEIIPDTVNAMFSEGRQRDVPLIVGANAGESSLQTNVPLMANLHSRTATSDTFVYNFTHLPTTWREEPCVAFHGVEIPYVFGAIPEGLSSPTIIFLSRGGGCSADDPGADAGDIAVADDATALWAQFARTGNPSIEGLIEWPAYSEENNRYLDIGVILEVKSGIEQSYVQPPGNQQDQEAP